MILTSFTVSAQGEERKSRFPWRGYAFHLIRFRILGLGFGVIGLGFSGFRVWELDFGVCFLVLQFLPGVGRGVVAWSCGLRPRVYVA